MARPQPMPRTYRAAQRSLDGTTGQQECCRRADRCGTPHDRERTSPVRISPPRSCRSDSHRRPKRLHAASTPGQERSEPLRKGAPLTQCGVPIAEMGQTYAWPSPRMRARRRAPRGRCRRRLSSTASPPARAPVQGIDPARRDPTRGCNATALCGDIDASAFGGGGSMCTTARFRRCR